MLDTKKDSSVWEVYELYVSTRFSQKYWACKLSQLEKRIKTCNFLLVLTALLVAVGVIADGNHWVLVGVSLCTFVFGFIGLVFGWQDQLKRYCQTLSEYDSLKKELSLLRFKIKSDGEYSGALKAKFKALLEEYESIEQSEAQEAEDMKIKNRCYDEVVKEVVPDRFFN